MNFCAVETYCFNCRRDFWAVRSTARFCSDVCKMAFNRRRANEIGRAYAKIRGTMELAYDADGDVVGRYVHTSGRIVLLRGGGEDGENG